MLLTLRKLESVSATAPTLTLLLVLYDVDVGLEVQVASVNAIRALTGIELVNIWGLPREVAMHILVG